MSGTVQKTKTGVIFDIFNYVFLGLLTITILLPFLHLLAQSFSAPGHAASSRFMLLPKGFTWSNYKTIAQNKFIWKGYGNTLHRTLLGTALSLLATSIGAYCLSKPKFPHRNFWTFFVVFTMFFGGGMIPDFLNINSLGLIDRRMSLILPSLVGAYNLVIMRNYFSQLPEEMEEAGKIDGAGNLRILFQLILPISLPMLATVGLWIAVGHWNAWFDCLIYIRDTDKFVLQIVLRRIVLEGTQQMMDSVQAQMDYQASPDAIKAACIFFTSLPILCVYPFVQKYFVKGVIIGALKG